MTNRFLSPALARAGVLAALLLGVPTALAQGPAGPPRLMINDVIPEGNHLVTTQRITSLLRTRPGTELSADAVKQDVADLMAIKQIGNVSVTQEDLPGGKVNVHFRIVEYPGLIQEIEYKGAYHLKPDDLDTITGLRKGGPMSPIANQMACQAIVRRYNEQGRPFAHCELLEGGKIGDTRVVFNITEGPIVKVHSIRFVGNTFVSGPRLATQLNSSKAILGLIGGVYVPAMADLDVIKLEDYYKSFGFHSVHVSRELEFSEDGRWVTLIFHVEEGPRYKIQQIDIKGPAADRVDQLAALTKMRQGAYYDKATITADVNAIKDWYGWQGRNATVKEEMYTPDLGSGLCTVQYEVQEAPPDRVGTITVRGNDVTRQNVILRQVPLYPGQILTYPDVRVGERNLARLGIFETNPETGVKPTITVLPSDNEFKDILVDVQETRTGSLLFGLGVTSDAGLTGSIVLNEKNFDISRPPTSFDDLFSGHAFRGAGQELRLEAVPGTQLQRYSATFREPFLFDSPYSLTVGGYYYDRTYDEYTENRLGARVTLGRKLNDAWSINGTVRVEDVGVHSIPLFAPPEITVYQGDNFLLGMRLGLTRDKRDSYLRPTEGSLIDISAEEVTGNFNFPILNAEYNQYFTVYQRADGSGRHVLAFRGQASWAGSDAPVFERFYAGGFRSLRGFAFRGVGPDVDGFKTGGDFMLLTSLEYQVPVRANDQLFLVGFVDGGTVEQNVEIKNYRVAAGVGIRFTVPMLGPVPIALDFGFPIVKAPTDKDQVFSFWLGFFH
jgi:outer membrane protein assembly complex protein YaeT